MSTEGGGGGANRLNRLVRSLDDEDEKTEGGILFVPPLTHTHTQSKKINKHTKTCF